MKILGISGSTRGSDSSTNYALNIALKGAKDEGVDIELIDLGKYSFNGCIACGGCSKSPTCSQDDDFKNIILPKLLDSNIGGVIFASPVYFGGVSYSMKAFMDRCYTIRKNGFKWNNVIAGALTVGRSRNGGQELAALDIVKNALIQSMIIVSDGTPTSHFGATLWSGHSGGVKCDADGLKMVASLGRRVANTAIKLM